MLTTRFVDGAPNWIDVGSPDLDGAASFYGALFGWRFVSAGPDAGGYGFFQLDGRTVAGGMRPGPGQGPPAWTVYSRSEDAQATAKAAEEAHGSVLFQPMDVMGEGRMAILADRAGVPFGIWQPGRTAGVDMAGRAGRAVLGRAVHAGHRGSRRVLPPGAPAWRRPGCPSRAGRTPASIPTVPGRTPCSAGWCRSDDPSEAESGAYWLPYFEVADTDAVVEQAQRLGGTVRMPATSVEGVGPHGQARRSYGVRFAVIRGEPAQAEPPRTPRAGSRGRGVAYQGRRR